MIISHVRVISQKMKKIRWFLPCAQAITNDGLNNLCYEWLQYCLNLEWYIYALNHSAILIPHEFVIEMCKKFKKCRSQNPDIIKDERFEKQLS